MLGLPKERRLPDEGRQELCEWRQFPPLPDSPPPTKETLRLASLPGKSRNALSWRGEKRTRQTKKARAGILAARAFHYRHPSPAMPRIKRPCPGKEYASRLIKNISRFEDVEILFDASKLIIHHREANNAQGQGNIHDHSDDEVH